MDTDLIRRRMATLGWDEAELARRAGLPQSTAHRVLSGEREPRLGTAAKLATALGMSLDVLAGRKAVARRPA